MASKKYKLLFLGVFSLLSCGVFAQGFSSNSVQNNPEHYDIFDSSLVPNSRMNQFNDFMNHAYEFPPKPRNGWEVGVSGGMPSVAGDVRSKLPTFGFGVHVRKALGYVFSLRMQYFSGSTKGLDWQASSGFSKNSAWNGAANGVSYVGNGPVYYNYKTRIQDLSLQGIVTLNNIRFHKGQSKMTFYTGGGIGITGFYGRVNALNGDAPYNFSNLNGTYSDRKDVIDALKDMMDDSYETPAQNNRVKGPKVFGMDMKPSFTVLAGIQFKLSRSINIALEDRFTTVKTDLLDGQQWQEHTGASPVLTRDFDSYNYLSLGFNLNLGNKSKSVEPLWWINPLNYAYSELSNPRHMLIPDPILPDGDGDGVIDQFDKCPDTPAGVAVNIDGCPLDTDGDGVPDYLDKELITPTYCQPVDEDGVGKCPDPECCKNLVPANTCDLGALPSINFASNSSKLSNDNQAMLATVASRLRNNPTCTISVVGYPIASKSSQSLANKRVEAIKKYLTEKEGISADRIFTNNEVGGGAVNTIDLRQN